MSDNEKVLVIDFAIRELGLWCDRCKLPSAFAIGATILDDAGVSTLGTMTRCEECAQ